MTLDTTIDTILLDRDGTLIAECHYLCDPDQVRLLPDIGEPWRALAARGCRFFLVTNQSGIARGMFTTAEYHAVDHRLRDLLAAQDLHLTDSAFCPHGPHDGCTCRKPAPGLWHALAERHRLRPETAIMIGDKSADIRFGRATGCRTALVRTGHGEAEARKMNLPALEAPFEPCPSRDGWPDWQARSLGDVLRMLVQQQAGVHAHRI